MGGGAQRPVRRGNAPKKTGARSARARTRGQNPLVYSNICLENIKTFMLPPIDRRNLDTFTEVLM
jgi:hypothetical protein